MPYRQDLLRLVLVESSTCSGEDDDEWVSCGRQIDFAMSERPCIPQPEREAAAVLEMHHPGTQTRGFASYSSTAIIATYSSYGTHPLA